MAHRRSQSVTSKNEDSEADHDEALLQAGSSMSFMNYIGNELQNISIANNSRRRRKLFLGLVFMLLVIGTLYTSHISLYHPIKVLDHAPEASEIYLSPAEPFTIHPIIDLVAENEAKFAKLVNRQSKTLEDAVEVYRKRYGRCPPPKFDRWFALAQSNGLVLIDEFDVMMRCLEPYWGVDPVTLGERFESRARDQEDMTTVTFNSSGIFGNKESFQVDVMKTWLADLPWQDMISSVEVAHGRSDEAAVNVAYNDLHSAFNLASTQKSSIDGTSPTLPLGDSEVRAFDMRGRYVWEYMRDSCQPSDPVMMRAPPEQSETEPLSFIQDVAKSMDPCLNPYLRKHYAMFLSPGHMYLTKHLVPVLSQSRATIFNDVLYPAPFYYTQDSIAKEDSIKDPAWNEKLDRAYWVGSPWGGDLRVENWRQFQRQKMVLQLAPNNDEPVHLLELKDQSGWARRSGATWSDLAAYFHVRMGVAEPSCHKEWEAEACEQQAATLKPQVEALEEGNNSKYVLDLDGKSFSGRFYRLLKSNSAVLKQTIMEEWHDDWLVPWVHYVPITLEARELGEVTRFLIEEREGQVIGEKIARQSKEWSRSVLRKQDASLWFLRLLMEMERLMDSERNNLFYE